jgi:copper chaperone CopZ
VLVTVFFKYVTIYLLSGLKKQPIVGGENNGSRTLLLKIRTFKKSPLFLIKMSLRRLNKTGNKAELTENKLFIAVAVVVVAFALMVYGLQYPGEQKLAAQAVGKSTTTSTTIESTTTTLPATTTTLPDVIIPPSTTTSTSTTIKATTTTSTSTSTTISVPSYLSKYSGRGYRQAYIDITFFCPSCVPAVAGNLQDEDGVMSKSLSYRQKISWIIYDPERVSLERIVQLAGANGEATLINDTGI